MSKHLLRKPKTIKQPAKSTQQSTSKCSWNWMMRLNDHCPHESLIHIIDFYFTKQKKSTSNIPNKTAKNKRSSKYLLTRPYASRLAVDVRGVPIGHHLWAFLFFSRWVFGGFRVAFKAFFWWVFGIFPMNPLPKVSFGISKSFKQNTPNVHVPTGSGSLKQQGF